MGHSKKTIAVFDFDGTLIKGESFSRFILFAAPWYRLLGSFVVFPALLLFLFRALSRHKAKEIIFSHFFKGMNVSEFTDAAKRFSLKKIEPILRKEAIEKAMRHKGKGHELIVASASIVDWILPWAEKRGFSGVIGTLPEIKNNKLTGKFIGKNCFGKEKLRRFIDKHSNRDEYFLYVYTDSRKDAPLLNIADEAFLNKF